MDKFQIPAIWSGKFFDQTATGSAARSFTRHSRLSALHKNSYLAQLDFAERATAALKLPKSSTPASESIGGQKKLDDALRIFLD